jgi:CelD/BcsL family acetyltransferase involved in cellulose biosynthesis
LSLRHWESKLNQLSTQCISTDDEFCSLKEEWTELLTQSRCNTLFLTWEWQYTWWKFLSEGRTLAIYTVRDGKQLIAIAPMFLRQADYSRLVPFRVLELLGSGSVGSDYLSIIVRKGDEEQALAEICKCLMSRKLVIELNNIDRGSSTLQTALLYMKEFGCRTAQISLNFSPYINLENKTWKSFLSQKGTSGRSRFDKKLNKLKRRFNVKFERTISEQERLGNLNMLISLHLKRWNDRGGSNAFDSKELCNFHDAFSRIALEKDWLRLYVLKLDDVPSAAVYSFYYLEKFYYYQAGFDPLFSQFSVGHLSLGMAIEQAFSDGAKEFDMLRGSEDYKYLWASNERELMRMSIYPSNLKGYACSQIMNLRNGLKTLIEPKVAEIQTARLQFDDVENQSLGKIL